MNVINGALVDRALGVNISSQGDAWAGQVGIYGDSIATNKRELLRMKVGQPVLASVIHLSLKKTGSYT